MKMKRLLMIMVVLGMAMTAMVKPVLAGDFKDICFGDTEKEIRSKMWKSPDFRINRDKYSVKTLNKTAKVYYKFLDKKVCQITLKFHSANEDKYNAEIKDFSQNSLKVVFTKLYGAADKDVNLNEIDTPAKLFENAKIVKCSDLFGTESEMVNISKWITDNKEITIDIYRNKELKMVAFNIPGNSVYKTTYNVVITITELNFAKQEEVKENAASQEKLNTALKDF